MFQSHNPALLIIDFQQAIDSFCDYKSVTAPRSQPDAEDNTARLLKNWRAKRWPCVHIRHSSKFEDSPYHQARPGFAFKDVLKPVADELLITKQENCAFIGTDLEQKLRAQNISELVVCGVLINNSVDATVRIASALGFKAYVVADATAAMGITSHRGEEFSAQQVQDIYLANLDGEYAQVCWLKDILNSAS